MTLRTATVSLAGERLGEQLLDNRVCDCCGTAAGRTREGVVVAYRNRSDDEIRDIQLVRQSNTGWSEPVTVYPDEWKIAGCPVNGPALLAWEDTVVVAWFTMAQDTAEVRLVVSRNGGRNFGTPLRFDSGTAMGRVDLARLSDGFALSWMSEVDSGALLRLATFDEKGHLADQHDLVEVAGVRASGFPRLLSMPSGALLLTWTGLHAETGLGQVNVVRLLR